MAKPKFNARVSVGVFLRNSKGELLVIKKKKTQEWGMVGGKLEAGESLQEAAYREALEETGLHVRLGAVIGCFSSKRSGIFIVFEGSPIGNSSKIVLEKIHDEYRWINPDNISMLNNVRPRLKRFFESCQSDGVYEVRILED